VKRLSISVTVNGEPVYTESWVGEARPWQLISDLQLPQIDITENTNIQFSMTNINGDPENSFERTSSVYTNITNKLWINVITDSDAISDGNTIKITSAFGEVIFEEDLWYPDYEYSFEVVLEDLGCYALSISDVAGNGFSHGKIEIKDNQNRILFDDIDFGGGKEFLFNASLNSGLNNIIPGVSMTLSPNPARAVLNLKIENEDRIPLQASISSIEGLTTTTFNNQLNVGVNKLDISELSSGIYFLNLESTEGRMTKKFIKL